MTFNKLVKPGKKFMKHKQSDRKLSHPSHCVLPSIKAFNQTMHLFQLENPQSYNLYPFEEFNSMCTTAREDTTVRCAEL